MAAPPTVADVDAMAPEARMQFLGNWLYPGVVPLTGEALAGKVTGMLLELPTVEIVPLLTSLDALKESVGAAIDALPADMLDLLGEAKQTESVQSAASSPEPRVSPTSTMTANFTGSPGGWADADDDEEMPCVGDLFAAGAARRKVKESDEQNDAGAMDDDDDDDGYVCSWDPSKWALEPDIVKLCAFIAERLEEPQVRIVRAVVEVLGPHAALALLDRTERCVHRGGMVVEETGKSRTKGGIFVKLLKDAPDLPDEGRVLTLARIKKEGDEAKKTKARALAEKRARAAGKATSPSAAAASPPAKEKIPKPSLADFMTPGVVTRVQ
jgi:hypothetical protein